MNSAANLHARDHRGGGGGAGESKQPDPVHRRHESLADRIEIELIRSVYDALIPSAIMSICFILAGAMICWRASDRPLSILVVCGSLLSGVRLAEAWNSAKLAARVDLTIEQARRLERRFDMTYCAFAAILGLFGARALCLPLGQAHMLTLCLLMGYAAGVAAGAGLRPRIAVRSMCLAIVPAIAVLMSWRESLYCATAIMTAAFLAGGIRSVKDRHARAIRDIERQLTFAHLARQDVLTALPNRLGLREWFDEQFRAAPFGAAVAVHCLDLNGFKAINDNYGHPTGDALLIAAAQRFSNVIRETDLVARLGGDEFAIVQGGVREAQEAEQMARRLRAALDGPFRLGEHTVAVSTSVGYVVADQPGQELEQLISLADQALYRSKQSGDIARHPPYPAAAAAALWSGHDAADGSPKSLLPSRQSVQPAGSPA